MPHRGPPLSPVSAAGRRRRPTCAPDSTAARPVPRQRRRPRLPPSRRRGGSSACWPHSSAPWPTASRRPPPQPGTRSGPGPNPSAPALTTPPWAVSRAALWRGRSLPPRTRTVRPTPVNKCPFLRPALSACAPPQRACFRSPAAARAGVRARGGFPRGAAGSGR